MPKIIPRRIFNQPAVTTNDIARTGDDSKPCYPIPGKAIPNDFDPPGVRSNVSPI